MLLEFVLTAWLAELVGAELKNAIRLVTGPPGKNCCTEHWLAPLSF